MQADEVQQGRIRRTVNELGRQISSADDALEPYTSRFRHLRTMKSGEN